MTDRQIPFSGSMVRALLEGRKTQTRRVLNPQPEPFDALFSEDGRWWTGDAETGEVHQVLRVPYAIGDRLYVREAWRAMDGQDKFSGAQIAASCTEAGYRSPWSPIQYEADGERVNWIAEPHTFGTKPGRYRHARFMPRWASRLTLTVTDARVQRLQEISEQDALAEGARPDPLGQGMWTHGASVSCDGYRDPVKPWFFSASDSFQALWESLHGPKAWDENPWVVALTFEVHRCNIDSMGN